MYNPVRVQQAPLIHPVVNFPAAGGIRARAPSPPSSVDPVRYPVQIQERGLSLGPEDDLVAKARSAADWVRTRIRKFSDLERRLSLAHHQAAQVEAAARQAGQLEVAQDAMRVRETAFMLILDYDQVKTTLEDLLAKVPGLGAIPVLVLIAAGAAIISLSLAMAAMFRRETALEKSLDLVAAGAMTPEEAAKMSRERSGTLFAGLGLPAGIGGLVAITVAIAVGLPILADALVPPRRK